MKNYSNFYIFIYASVLVLLVAVILSFTAFKLKPRQEKNIEIKKEQDILASFGVVSAFSEADALFAKHVKNSFVINSKGEDIEGDAFTINLKEQMAKPADQRQLPMYECEVDGNTIYTIPVWGVGMWGPIWGYIALQDDLNTIYGVTFSSESETPGLGAEIASQPFQEPFKGKTIFDDNGNFVSIAIVKGGAPAGDNHAVDAVSGGTITSIALQKTIFDCLDPYVTYLKNHKK